MGYVSPVSFPAGPAAETLNPTILNISRGNGFVKKNLWTDGKKERQLRAVKQKTVFPIFCVTFLPFMDVTDERPETERRPDPANMNRKEGYHMKKKLLVILMLATLLLAAVPTVSLAAAPKTPAIKKVTPGEVTATVSWNAVGGAKGYEIRWGKTNTIGWTTKSTTGTSYEIKGLKNNTKYTIQIRAYYKSGSKTLYTSWSSKAYTTTKISVSSVKTDTASVQLQAGKTRQLTATVSPSNASNKAVTWSSSDPKVATVSGSGLVTAKKAGTATITAKSNNGKTAKVTVKVTKSAPAVTKVTLNQTSVEMRGKPVTLKATCQPSGSDQTVTWTTSNKKVATVSSKGVVTPTGYGTCEITATSKNGKTAKCTVKVQKKTYISQSYVVLDLNNQVKASVLCSLWSCRPQYANVSLFRVRITDYMTVIVDGLTGRIVKYDTNYDRPCDTRISKGGLASLYGWDDQIKVVKITDTYVEFEASHRTYCGVDVKKYIGVSLTIEGTSVLRYRVDNTGKLTLVSLKQYD